MRVNVGQLCQLLTEDANGNTREVGARFGAVAERVGQEVLYRVWEQHGYHVRRLQPDATGRESGVDEAIQAMAYTWLLGDYGPRVRPVLALATADGNDNSGGTTFVQLAELAMRHHWRVEMFVWRHGCNQRYLALAAQHPQNITIVFLDRWREQLTFTADRPAGLNTAAPSAAAYRGTAAPDASSAVSTSVSNGRPAAASSQPHRPSDQPSGRRHTLPCRNWAAGHCRFGDNCDFRHDPPAGQAGAAASSSTAPLRQAPLRQAPICRFFTNGHCRDGRSCRFSHDRPSAPPPRAAAAAAAAAPPSPPPATPAPSAPPSPHAPDNVCIICADAPVTTALRPCFHTHYCAACANELVRRGDPCPSCRQRVEGVQRIYM